MSRRHRIVTRKRPKAPEAALLDAVARRFEDDLARLEGTPVWRDWTAADRLTRMKTTRQPEHVEKRLTAHRWLDVLERYESVSKWPTPVDDEGHKRDEARQVLTLRREAFDRGSRSPAHSAERQRCAELIKACDARLAGGLFSYAGDLRDDDAAALEVGTIEWPSDVRTMARSKNARRAMFGRL
jgi:hypothetical protein